MRMVRVHTLYGYVQSLAWCITQDVVLAAVLLIRFLKVYLFS